MRRKTKTAIAAMSLAALSFAVPLKSEGRIGAGASTFGGYHEKQGAILGGGINLSCGERIMFHANMDIASLAMEKPVIYSYGAALSFPLTNDSDGRVFCAKDGIIGTPGCGGWLTHNMGRYSLSAGAEYRTTNTISVKTSLSGRFHLAFLRIKAKILGYLNTKDKDEQSGGADLGLEIAIKDSAALFSRYNYFTKGDLRGQHAILGGLSFNIDYK